MVILGGLLGGLVLFVWGSISCLALPLTAVGRVALDYAISTRQIPLIMQTDEQPLAPDAPKQPRRRTTRRPSQTARAKTGANQGEG